MDPNEALKNAREASKKMGQARTNDELAAAAVDLMMYFDALDQSMTGGVFPPNDWGRKGREINKPGPGYTGRREVSPRGF